MARFLEARSQQEREERAAHLLALLLVAGVATVKHVSGVTSNDAPFTLFAIAVAASAAYGGFGPAVVAALASVLAAGIGAQAPGTPARLLFAAEALSIAGIVSFLKGRAGFVGERLAAAHERIAGLKLRERRAKLLESALGHLEEAAGETAVVVVDDAGWISDWRGSAERLYGYSAEQAIGNPAAALFERPQTPGEFWELLQMSRAEGPLRREDVHRRADGSTVSVEMEIRPFRHADISGFTLAVHDLARHHEWNEYRREAARAQEALREAADDTRRQLAALESLTDPALNPLEGVHAVTELLERLRSAVRADGVALVQPGRVAGALLAACGLQPSAGPVAAESPRLAPGRVAIVHNDPVRVEQLSALRWPPGVSSLVVVPVVHDGRAWASLEVVGERSRQVSDWDAALARVVADRLAALVVQGRGLAAKAS